LIKARGDDPEHMENSHMTWVLPTAAAAVVVVVAVVVVIVVVVVPVVVVVVVVVYSAETVKSFCSC